MNSARAKRHLSEAGFTREQATALIEVVQDAVASKVAAKDSVGLGCERLDCPSELDAADTLVRRWIVVIAVVQTAVTIFGTAGLIEIMK